MNRTKRVGRATTIGESASATRKRGASVKHKPWPKFGVQCVACHQRIKPLTRRRPVKTEEGVTWLHGGCTLAPQP